MKTLEQFLDELEANGNVLVIHAMDVFKNMEILIQTDAQLIEQTRSVWRILIDETNNKIILVVG